MASALEKVMKGTLQKSDSQKAFTTWWESFEDKLLYSVMIFGMITLPFNMVSNTPVECTLDQNHESFKNLSLVDRQPMRYHHFFLRKFCTMNFIHDAMIFLPFILLLAPLPLVGVGRMCLQYFCVQKRMDAFYKLLVKESLDREDVEALEMENLKNSHEVLQMFQDSNGIYYSYLSKSVIQVIIGSGIASLLIWCHFWGLSGEDITCVVFQQHYVCVVPLATFYDEIVLISAAAIVCYVFTSLYTFLWVRYPRLSSFNRFMQLSQRYIDDCISLEKLEKMPKHFTKCFPLYDTAEPFFDNYFDRDSRDLGLLITLLACKNGVAEGLRFVSLFDKDYKRLWKPIDVHLFHDEKVEQVVHVEWDDAPIASFINSFRGRIGRMRVEYTVEIVPNNVEAPIKNHKYRSANAEDRDIPGQRGLKYHDSFHGLDLERRPRRPPLTHQPCSVRTADGLEYFNSPNATTQSDEAKKKPEYKITISTEVNGRTIAQRTEKIPPAPVMVAVKKSASMNRSSLLSELDEQIKNFDQ